MDVQHTSGVQEDDARRCDCHGDADEVATIDGTEFGVCVYGAVEMATELILHATGAPHELLGAIYQRIERVVVETKELTKTHYERQRRERETR